MIAKRTIEGGADMLRNQLTVHATSARAVEPGNRWQRVKLVVAAAVTLGAVAACQSGGPEAAPTETPTATEPTTSAPAWQSEYSEEEIEAYDQALGRWTAYRAAVQRVYAAGKATPAAKRVFQEYYIPWIAYWKQLQQFESAGIQLSGTPVVLESEATRIKLGGDGSSVTIRQCVDSTAIEATQNGTPVKNAYDTPQIVRIVASQANGNWYFTQVPAEPKDEPCGA